MIGDFHFMYPGWLWLLLLVPVVLWRILRQQGKGGWQGIVDEQLAPFVLSGHEQPHRWRTTLVIGLLSLTAIVALSGPAWEKKQLPAFRSQQAVVVALDLSASMYARDMTPNRLDAARFKLLDLLNSRKDGQTGLVVFAGDAFVVSPLTDDTDTIAAQVKNLSPEVMPVQGSYPSAAIARSVEILDQAAQGNGHILLISDGVSDADVAQAQRTAKAAYDKGYTVSVLTVGTEAGAPVPLSNGGFLADSSGKTAMPRLDAKTLGSIVDAGHGLLVNHRIDDLDLRKLDALWAASLQDAALLAGDDRKLDDWFNQGIWLVLLLIPVAMLFFRRGWLAVWLLVFASPQPQQAQASVWDDLWQTPDQQGQQALQNGDAGAAVELFNNPEWKAAAAYKAGDYAQAEKFYAGSKTQEGLYNYGNALARQGKLDQAIAAYEELLKQNPDHADALHNKNVLEAQKQQEQEQREQNSRENQDKQNGEQNNQNNDQQDGDGQQQNQSGESDDSSPQQEPDSPAEESAEQDEQNQSGESESSAADEQESSEQEQGSNPEQPMDAETKEQAQAMEQWLRRIPDDPSGLWRRKFQYQYRQRSPRAGQREAW